MDISNFPSLTGEEFLEACHYLDRIYCQATLGPLRSIWKLRVHPSLYASFTIYGVPSTVVEISRPLDRKPGIEDVELDLAGFSISGPQTDDSQMAADSTMMETEDEDRAAVLKPAQREGGYVVYEVHLHPTYRMPCLWFRLHDLPNGDDPLNIDTVFHYLVPREYKDGLRRYGSIGGISLDHHPVNGSPCWFVHPCLAGDQMAGFQCTKENYLMIWLGLVGGCVGLWVPKEMALP